jgi:phage-related protein
MKKEIFYDKNAAKELKKFAKIVQREFQALIEVLKLEGKLESPDAKKISKSLFEIRVVKGGAYRGFYAYIKNDYIVILHFFQKKTQKTPLKNIKLAGRRLKQYE